MDVNKFKVPIPIMLIAFLYIIATLFSGYDLLISEKVFRPYHIDFWFNSFFFITGIIIGIGLPLRNKVAYVLFLIEALLAIAGGGFMIVFFIWTDIINENPILILVGTGSLIIWFLVYRYVRSLPIRRLYFEKR